MSLVISLESCLNLLAGLVSVESLFKLSGMPIPDRVLDSSLEESWRLDFSLEDGPVKSDCSLFLGEIWSSPCTLAT